MGLNSDRKKQGDYKEYIYVYIKRHKQGLDEGIMNGERLKFSAKIIIEQRRDG